MLRRNGTRVSEIDLVERIRRLVKCDSSVVCGIGDDAAVIKYTKDKYLLFTADMLVEGIDFYPDDRPSDLGHKSISCSLSDIAAMAGIPKYALVSLGLPKRINKAEFIDGFYKGAMSTARSFKLSIVGGDLSSSQKIVIDISMIGEVKKDNLVLRSGARPQDMIFVTGSLGGSLYGRHLRFRPRLKEASYLSRNYKINSMIDISDGLTLDLYRLTQASSVGAVIYENLIPVSSEAKSPDEALYMGEDFELLFTLPKIDAKRLTRKKENLSAVLGALAQQKGKEIRLAGFTRIGEIRERGYGLKLVSRCGQEKILEPKGYQHF